MVGQSWNPSIRFDLSLLKALVLDIDGILYEGDRPLPGAVALIDHLNQTDTPYVLFTNNSTRRLGDHEAKLHRLRMPVPREKILTSSIITSEVLAAEAPHGTRCLVVGEAGLIEALETAGFEVTQSEADHVQYVVTGMDRSLTYQKLLAAARAIWNGAQLISSNPDPIYPTGDGVIPAAGVVQAAIEVSTGIKARVIGKPEAVGFQLALQKLGYPAETVGMVGDQPKTDHLGAQRVGMKCLLVLSTLTPSYSGDQEEIPVDGIYRSTLDFFNEWVRR